MYRNGYDVYFTDDRFQHRNLLQALWVSVVSTIRIWWATRELSSVIQQERKELADLPDHILSDIGIDRAAATAESRRYDLPLDRVRQMRVWE